MMVTNRIVLSLITLILPLVIANSSKAQNWPQFRGPGGNAFSSDMNIPSTWDDSKNMLWKCALLGKGASSPIVWKNNIFVTCFTNAASGIERTLVCIDKKFGQGFVEIFCKIRCTRRSLLGLPDPAWLCKQHPCNRWRINICLLW